MATRRSIWTGSISFGLVNIPVRLYTATVSHDISFHQFQAKTGQRIHNKRVAERSGREVPYDQIVKGYEVRKGKIVLVDPKELETLEPKRTRTIEIEQFVELAEIDPILWDTTYYVGTEESAGAQKSYHLLRAAMEETGKVGIGRFVMRTKEYLVTVRPFGRGLALETMFYADEIRDQEEAAGTPGKAVAPARELQMARQLIEAMSAPFDLKKFEDTYRDRVRALLEKKARGEEIVVEEPPEETGQVVDLMEALKASLAGGDRGRKSAAQARNGSGRKQPANGRKKETRRPSSRKTARSGQTRAA
jgi:DNA end-binding protein Ku